MASAWLEERRTRFEAWQREHPDLEARVAVLKERTAALAEERREESECRAARQLAAQVERSRSLPGSERERIEALRAKALERWEAGERAEAAEDFERILAMDAVDAVALVHCAELQHEQGDLEGAAERYSRAAAIQGRNDEEELPRLRALLALQSLPPPRDPRVDEPPLIFRVEDAPAELWDAPEAPPLTIVPGGEYSMGSPTTEVNHQPSEALHRVSLAYPLAVSTCDITRGEFGSFVAETGYEARGCSIFVEGRFVRDPEADWRSPGFEQSDSDPVVCISYYDAVAYTRWLSSRTGRRYRLPSEAEWEYAVRGGTTTLYPWGDAIGTGHANCDGCTEGAAPGRPTPGGTFPPNGFGLYDVCGNVWKWLADCWNRSYEGAPTDGSAWLDGNVQLRGRRGGSWFNIASARAGDYRAPFRLRSAARFGSLPDLRYSSFGLRVVRDL